MAGSEYSVDSGWDDMHYDFGVPNIPACYRGEFQFLCSILQQWVEDLSSPDQNVRNEAQAWLGRKKDVAIVCDWIGINPRAVEKLAKQKRWIEV